VRDGLVVVDKPTGCTSHDVVARLRRIYGQRRVGHAGTLDPDATGVLLVGLGRATRLLRFLAETGKTYRGDVVLGVATSTLDAAGVVLDRRPMPVTRAQLDDVARRFVGDVQQVPPMVSALKVGGRRLHDLARHGEEVERAPRPVRIDRLDIEHFEPGPYPVATILVECSTGTYVRSLAADLGVALGGCAHLRALRRLRVGSFDVSEAHTLDTIAAAPDDVLLTPATAMRDLERLGVDDEQARAVRHGMTFPCSTLPAALGPGPFAVADQRGELLAVYERGKAGIKPTVVLSAAPAGD
jgi:tRNA pseudouridine55 synthase